ncbi:aminotransferase class V-fold PLP-dependent enzyme [Leucobacter sp. M11]|uniref:aminotransferase class V-fold PLP-dependent enzyme n=1 Tax=Leucobacter sp. M11 TaxID=2993565 RepID=UPI002D7FD83E|nr:aminotransferase class V-fold PLP-dependent enzyme [Leucobacter sp. M11]MEB4616510.1 aminotransferase class V-fold PLP-dependent enzyme [Leucobacter sp. M11]
MTIVDLAAQFTAQPGYLAACTGGLPSLRTQEAIREDLARWSIGDLDAARYVTHVERSRVAYAELVGVAPERVAIGAQVSGMVSLIAAAVPDGAEVLAVSGEFSSLTHPFERQAHRGVTVRYVELAELPGEITPETYLVAYSLVQSATGALAPQAEILRAAREAGALTLADLTQATGWLPVNAAENDATICHAYKWLCSPRGTAFLTLSPELTEAVNPTQAGWASADDIWGSCYAGNTPLGSHANRFDVSPAWQAWVGTAAALELFDRETVERIHEHDLRLANAFRAGIGSAPGDSAIVTWADPDGSALAQISAAGITASGRAGNARVAFHIWNTDADVAALLAALGRAAG